MGIAYWVGFFPGTLVMMAVAPSCLFFLTSGLALLPSVLAVPIAILVSLPFVLVVPLAMQEFGLQVFGGSKIQILSCVLLGFVLCIAPGIVLSHAHGLVDIAADFSPLVLWYVTLAGPGLIIGRWGWKGMLPGALLSWGFPIVMQYFPACQDRSLGILGWIFLGWLPALVYAAILAGVRPVIFRAVAGGISRWEKPARAALARWYTHRRELTLKMSGAVERTPEEAALYGELSKLAETWSALLPMKKRRRLMLVISTVMVGAVAAGIALAIMPAATFLATVAGCGLGNLGIRLAFLCSAPQRAYSRQVRDIESKQDVCSQKIDRSRQPSLGR